MSLLFLWAARLTFRGLRWVLAHWWIKSPVLRRSQMWDEERVQCTSFLHFDKDWKRPLCHPVSKAATLEGWLGAGFRAPTGPWAAGGSSPRQAGWQSPQDLCWLPLHFGVHGLWKICLLSLILLLHNLFFFSCSAACLFFVIRGRRNARTRNQVFTRKVR